MWSGDPFWYFQSNINIVATICATMHIGAELAIQTIFVIQFQTSRQTSS